ncbi:thiamine phosphate synthase [Marinovum sp. 2_MG-2023]|uniref:thiamine phosphate synthase n=1 Tax=unclassified Marinovum TaxID=2647166 RepID=UPI0026E48456|nr:MULTISPECIES: thiamine phosphate synthase [unclassified Marinovum]MDO6729453.1 thiamine phosphate synthase [Marinovum sp. 2_MG-2023]MDO6781311.1 thiamine phosphate synthase [Marinovum sp. 1_MG-2023]
MAEIEHPQIYLVTPPSFELSSYGSTLESVLDAVPVACLRLALASHDEDEIARAADLCRDITHARDIALVISNHVLLAERLGLDGVHLDDTHSVRAARKTLGEEAIVGLHAGVSRHDGMNGGEAGADYICFGPVGENALGDGAVVERELFDWWSKVIELPVVAEGGLDEQSIRELAPMTDFFALGDEIWSDRDPVARIKTLYGVMTA